MNILEVENVSYSYNQKNNAVENLSFSVKKGEYVALLGANGSGKSTLAKMLNALIIPDSGKVLVSGLCSADKNSVYEIRKKVGVVFQNPDNQFVASKVEDDVAFGLENIGVKSEEIGKRIDFALNAVNMTEYKDFSPERLSGGQKQRVAIAGVLALNPEILVLDEATAMLDPVGRKEVINTVKKLNEKGVTVIAITHYMDEVLDADSVIVLKDGKLALKGSPKEIFSQKKELKSLGLELPSAMALAEILRENGVPLKKGIFSKEELAEELCKL